MLPKLKFYDFPIEYIPSIKIDISKSTPQKKFLKQSNVNCFL